MFSSKDNDADLGGSSSSDLSHKTEDAVIEPRLHLDAYCPHHVQPPARSVEVVRAGVTHSRTSLTLVAPVEEVTKPQRWYVVLFTMARRGDPLCESMPQCDVHPEVDNDALTTREPL